MGLKVLKTIFLTHYDNIALSIELTTLSTEIILI